MENQTTAMQTTRVDDSAENQGEEFLWSVMRTEAGRDAESEPALASFLDSAITSQSSLHHALSFQLANKLCSQTLLSSILYEYSSHLFRKPDPTRRHCRRLITRHEETRPLLHFLLSVHFVSQGLLGNPGLLFFRLCFGFWSRNGKILVQV
ncbi:hypothetical protein RD792_003857 [Penstemon davidsonii]|uniref:Serine acetyltransferase N-terminal domain-containing protein n=1 Tax=Penstemon davidsonii TaxID=160366 RepID=A0ABR0DFU8_9LAMI|nr:hypothetical protein RD792_003857 [Penstemon davidsonii]